MKHRESKLQVKWILLAVCVLLLGGILFFALNSTKTEPVKAYAQPADHINIQVPVLAEVPVTEEDDSFHPDWTKEDFDYYYNINSEYVGQLRFESGIINEPVVQPYSHSKYLFANFATQAYDIYGTVFMDAAADTDSMNITMYGHYCYPEVDPEQKLMFTPLHILKEEENYEANRYIDFLLENEARRYQIVTVYYCPLNYSADTQAYDWTDEELSYYYTSFDPVFFENYKALLKDMQFYDIGIDYSNEDHLLTLQTCVPNHDELRLIVVAKEVERIPVE